MRPPWSALSAVRATISAYSRRARGPGASLPGWHPARFQISYAPRPSHRMWVAGKAVSMAPIPCFRLSFRASVLAMNAIDLASLMCSRLCHDLLSPVGALNNGIELLADEQDPEMRERCLELLADSARVTANKLKFFRLAFGAGGGFGDEIDTAEARAAVDGLYGAE